MNNISRCPYDGGCPNLERIEQKITDIEKAIGRTGWAVAALMITSFTGLLVNVAGVV